MKLSDEQNANLVRGNTELLVLAVLSDGPAYGYSIAKEIDQRTNGHLALKQGSVYSLLYSLEADAFISSEWSQPPKGERPRRMYRITSTGLEEFERRLETFARFSNAVYRVAGRKPEVAEQ